MAFYQDWWTDRVRGGGKIDPLTGKQKGDWLMDSLGSMVGGVDPGEVHRATDTAVENLSGHKLVKSSGVSYEDLGLDPKNTSLTTAGVGNALSNYRTTEKEKARQTNKKDTIELTELSQAPQLESIRAQAAATTAQTAESARQFDVTQTGNRADRISERADKADDRIAQLELAEMQLAAEDRRATERWDREDKRERAQLIAQLFSGLGQVGGFI